MSKNVVSKIHISQKIEEVYFPFHFPFLFFLFLMLEASEDFWIAKRIASSIFEVRDQELFKILIPFPPILP